MLCCVLEGILDKRGAESGTDATQSQEEAVGGGVKSNPGDGSMEANAPALTLVAGRAPSLGGALFLVGADLGRGGGSCEGRG